MDYTLVRSRRKTLELRVLPDGSVEVRAPPRAAKSAIDAFVRSREGWIREKQAVQAGRAAQREAAASSLPASIPLFGRELPLLLPGAPEPGGRALRLSSADPAGMRALAAALYREAAGRVLPERAAYWAERVGLAPESVRIGAAKTSWGCCSGKGGVTFSYRLAAASPACIDYVVVHELCHLRELNHSPAFWALVERQIPDWKERREELHALARRLSLLGL